MAYPSAPTLAEDLLLILFQPDAGTIAGENTLSQVLAGAVLAELAFNGHVTTTTTTTGSARVEAVEGRAPSDDILRPAWDYAADRPGLLQATLAAIGPALRQPLLERLIARGDIREENGKVLGMFKKTTLKGGENGRRSGLIRGVRDVLVDSVDPTPRVAVLGALIWGSGTLQQFDPEIPWSPATIARAQELERGQWSGEGADPPAARAAAALIDIIAACILVRDEGVG